MAEKDVKSTSVLSADLEECRLADAAYDDFSRWVLCNANTLIDV